MQSHKIKSKQTNQKSMLLGHFVSTTMFDDLNDFSRNVVKNDTFDFVDANTLADNDRLEHNKKKLCHICYFTNRQTKQVQNCIRWKSLHAVERHLWSSNFASTTTKRDLYFFFKKKLQLQLQLQTLLVVGARSKSASKETRRVSAIIHHSSIMIIT